MNFVFWDLMFFNITLNLFLMIKIITNQNASVCNLLILAKNDTMTHLTHIKLPSLKKQKVFCIPIVLDKKDKKIPTSLKTETFLKVSDDNDDSNKYCQYIVIL